MRSCPRHSRTLAKCLAPSRGHSKTTPQRSAGRAVRSTELVPFSTSDEWYSRHRPVWFRLRRVRERSVVKPEPPLRSYAPAHKPIPDKIGGSVKRKPEPPVKKNKNKTWWMLAGVLAATFFAYANSFTVPFFLDNEEIILRDARIHTVSSTQVHRILTQQYWETATTGLYRPLTTLSFLFNYAILGGGANPESYHWINLLLHLANVAMVYLLFAAIFEQSAIPLLASALWALHPVQTE